MGSVVFMGSDLGSENILGTDKGSILVYEAWSQVYLFYGLVWGL